MSIFCLEVVFCFFFFFQAEDGIRDIGVTGVQTCALPIWPNGRSRKSSRLPRHPMSRGRSAGAPGSSRRPMTLTGRCPKRSLPPADYLPRSEERRVGKECRYRGSTDELKKNRMEIERE